MVYDSLPSTTAVFSYTIWSRKLSANEQVFVGAQTVVCLLQTTQILKLYQAFVTNNSDYIRRLFYITDHVAYTSSNKTKIVWIKTELFTQGECASCLRACLGARLLLWSYQYPNLSEGADRIGGQLHRDKECLFSGVTKSGRVWRKVLESDAQTLPFPMSSTPWVLYAYPMSLSTFPKFITLPFPLSLALPESCTCTPRLFQPFLSSLP